MDPVEQLHRLQEAGFELEIFERYPRHVGAIRGGCIALLEVAANGLKLTGVPGWRMGDLMGVLVGNEGSQVFQSKSEVLEATSERLEALRRFREDLEHLLMPAV
ncbi:MAG: hypothetical protein ABSD20_14430 [Terriglobales bacterium]|jgi:hypothetical protein